MNCLAHAEKSRIETRLSPEDDPEFQIAPMIDILLVLLVFFMSISSTEVLQKSDAVRLPVAREAASRADANQMVVNVLWVPANRSGVIQWNEATYTDAKQLALPLKEALKVNPKARLLIRADKDVRYELLKQVMMAGSEAGVRDVTFSVASQEVP